MSEIVATLRTLRDWEDSIDRILRPQILDITTSQMSKVLAIIKDRIWHNIYDEAVSKAPSPYEPPYTLGALGHTIHYRSRRFERKSGEIVRGYITVGRGLPYSFVHDRDGVTEITPVEAPFLRFYSHNEAAPGWRRVRKVERPGRPYFEEAVEYGMSFIGSGVMYE